MDTSKELIKNAGKPGKSMKKQQKYSFECEDNEISFVKYC